MEDLLKRLSQQFTAFTKVLKDLQNALTPNKREPYVWLYPITITAANTSTDFEFKLPTTHNRLIGFTFRSENADAQRAIASAKIGSTKLEFDRHPILVSGVPLLITLATEVCEECKFFRVCYDDVKDKKMSGSVETTDTTITYPITVSLLLLLDNPDYSYTTEEICFTTGN